MTLGSHSEPLVAIAIPVHNGGAEFERCLNSLREQTFRDFRVVVFENASTDSTLSRAQQLASIDDRFEVRPSDRFLPALDNFRRAIRECGTRSKYFCLRAADDYTSPNFLEVLVKALEENPSKALAVTDVVKIYPDREKLSTKPEVIGRILDRNRMANWTAKFPAPWYYGLYRSATSIDYLLRVWDVYPYVWGFDRLVIYKMLCDLGLLYRSGAVFYCQTGSGGGEKYKARSIAEALRRRLSYFHACMDMEAHKVPKYSMRALLSRWVAWRVAGEHTATTMKHLVKVVSRRKRIGKKTK